MVLKSFLFTLLVIVLLYSCGGSNQPKTGAAIYNDNCVLCHGEDGKLGLPEAKDLTISKLTTSQKKQIISYGKNNMLPFVNALSEVEIDSVVSYINNLCATQ